MAGPLTSAHIKAAARDFGFDLCGIAPAAALPELPFFETWLARGYAGDMAYLHRSAARRADVRAVLPTAKSVIVTATNYNTDRPYSTECADPGVAQIARYAWGDDYHDVLGRRLNDLLDWMREESREAFDALAYVDTGPVQERVYARHAGIGWIGKNTCVINHGIGSWLFLAEIICSLALEPDEPAFDRCGSCTLCLEACPTQAFVDPGVLDSTRCISYLTIEHRGSISEELRHLVGSHVYGCDVCQEVCPWNQAPIRSADPAWQPRPDWDAPAIADVAARPDHELRAALRGSAMRRAKIDGFRRNVALALDNTHSHEP
jgi:epoxyqueuosine reductase